MTVWCHSEAGLPAEESGFCQPLLLPVHNETGEVPRAVYPKFTKRVKAPWTVFKGRSLRFARQNCLTERTTLPHSAPGGALWRSANFGWKPPKQSGSLLSKVEAS